MYFIVVTLHKHTHTHIYIYIYIYIKCNLFEYLDICIVDQNDKTCRFDCLSTHLKEKGKQLNFNKQMMKRVTKLLLQDKFVFILSGFA